MRKIAAILLLICAPSCFASDLLIGTATIAFQENPNYQPGSCTTQAPQEDSVCINFWPWGRYTVRGFRDVNGTRRPVHSIVMTAHQARSGLWFLVLEKLSDADARAFGAEYKVKDASVVREAVCLREPIEKYREFKGRVLKLGSDESQYCYDTLELSHAK